LAAIFLVATHEASAPEFTVEPGDHQDRAIPEGFQADFSSVQPGQRGDPLRKRLAGDKARKFGWVGLEDVRARSSPTGRAVQQGIHFEDFAL
jgi:hypothetical protein